MHRPTTIATATAMVALIAGAAWAGAGPTQQLDLAASGSAGGEVDDDPSVSDLAERGAVTRGSQPTSSATPTPSPSPSSTPSDDTPLPGEVVATRDAAGAGSVTVAATGLSVELVGATAAPGWTAVVDSSEGRQVEVSFRGPEGRVDVKAEVDDGRLRIRVRDRRTGLRTEEHVGDGAGPVVRREADAERGSSGPGSSNDDVDDVDDTDSVDSQDTDSVDTTDSVDSQDTDSVDSDDTSGDD